MGTMYVAHVLFCSLLGQCELYHDKLGPVASIETCRARIDQMQNRVRDNPSGVVSKIGEIDLQAHHRGFCFSDSEFERNWEVYYSL